jgi:heme/copper-type cytochrome/quinol oxidase subunit 3
MITTSFANNRGRAVVLLFIAGATLFAFGALFERYFVASSSPPSQRWRKSESQQQIRGEARTSKRTFPSPTAEREEAKSIMVTIKKKSLDDLFFLLLLL